MSWIFEKHVSKCSKDIFDDTHPEYMKSSLAFRAGVEGSGFKQYRTSSLADLFSSSRTPLFVEIWQITVSKLVRSNSLIPPSAK